MVDRELATGTMADPYIDNGQLCFRFPRIDFLRLPGGLHLVLCALALDRAGGCDATMASPHTPHTPPTSPATEIIKKQKMFSNPRLIWQIGY